MGGLGWAPELANGPHARGGPALFTPSPGRLKCALRRTCTVLSFRPCIGAAPAARVVLQRIPTRCSHLQVPGEHEPCGEKIAKQTLLRRRARAPSGNMANAKYR
ncbi:hypothetical protein MTO96_017203 [Rhipicephalus appendiculatus]